MLDQRLRADIPLVDRNRTELKFSDQGREVVGFLVLGDAEQKKIPVDVIDKAVICCLISRFFVRVRFEGVERFRVVRQHQIIGFHFL